MTPKTPNLHRANEMIEEQMNRADTNILIGKEMRMNELAVQGLKKEVNGKYTNTLNNTILKYQVKQSHIADVLEVDTATISKHRNGKGPIGWDMAQMYSKYFIIQLGIMVDAFSLLTGKHGPKDKLYHDTLQPGKMPVIGEFDHSKTQVKIFDHTVPPMRLTSTMYNHYIFKNAEEWGLNVLIYADGSNTIPFENIDTFYYDDYHYWVFLNSPIKQNHVHKGALTKLSICKIKDKDLILAGVLYEKPRRNNQAPITYELVDPLFGMEKSFLPDSLNLNGVELDWASPVINVITNASASGIVLEKSNLVYP